MEDHQAERARGRDDHRNGRYDPGRNTTDWGYSDGWTAAADGAKATHGQALACHLSWTTGGLAAYERQQAACTETTPVVTL